MTIIQGDNVNMMRLMPPDYINLTVTSPPYDGLRTYSGYSFDFESIARQLYRITKPGGVVVWVVADATVRGSETGTSFRQALFFKDCGFNIHDTMIYRREGPPLSHNRYEQKFEFMFVFSKGKPTTFNGLRDPAITAGTRRTGTMRQDSDALSNRSAKGVVADTKLRGNVWSYGVGNNKSSTDKLAHQHPAIFPEKLAEDHIISWSNHGDLVLDPFCGSGTTGKMALLNGRRFIGLEISSEYCDLARARLEASGHGC